MQVKDPDSLRLVERIGDHYRQNISNRYIRPALLALPLDNQAWELIESLTEHGEQYRYQGIHLDDLYRQIAAAAKFVGHARSELAPNLRQRLGTPGRGADSDRVLRDMAINNFQSNLKVLADLLNELYVRLVTLDKAAAKDKPPYYLKVPELQGIGKLLVG
jgi:hypothetical protein